MIGFAAEHRGRAWGRVRKRRERIILHRRDDQGGGRSPCNGIGIADPSLHLLDCCRRGCPFSGGQALDSDLNDYSVTHACRNGIDGAGQLYVFTCPSRRFGVRILVCGITDIALPAIIWEKEISLVKWNHETWVGHGLSPFVLVALTRLRLGFISGSHSQYCEPGFPFWLPGFSEVYIGASRFEPLL